MFGTNKQFSLERLPFSVSGAFLSVYQPTDEKKLYFSICRSEGGTIERPKLLRIDLVSDGEDLPYIYYCDEAKLTIESPKGTAEITYEAAEIMRIRVKDVTMSVHFEPRVHEGGCERAPGEVELAFSFLGKLLFKDISGTMRNNAKWNFRQVCPYPFQIEIQPGADGYGEAAVHEYYSNAVAKDSYIPFDEAHIKMMAKFEEFFKNYPETPIQYRDMARKAAWVIWHTRLGPRGGLKNTMVYMQKQFMINAYGWQQCFHAMAMKNNAKEALGMLLVMFDYQNEHGGIPDHVSDTNQQSWICTKPPLFGYSVCYMLDNFDLSGLTISDYELLYGKLAAYTNYWFNQHDHMRTGFPSYYHANESGYDEATLFLEGLPLQAADLQAYMVMLCEACSRLATLTGKNEEAESWMSESKRVLSFLTDELWDGEQFLAKHPGSGKLYKCGSIAQLQPIMLGKRLPAEIISKLKNRLLDENEYLTEYGIATEHLKSDKVVMRAFTRGAVVAPSQCLLILGLHDAGEEEAARLIAARYLNALMVKGLALGIHHYRTEPVLGDEIALEQTPRAVGFPLSPWVSSIFMILANGIGL